MGYQATNIYKAVLVLPNPEVLLCCGNKSCILFNQNKSCFELDRSSLFENASEPDGKPPTFPMLENNELLKKPEHKKIAFIKFSKKVGKSFNILCNYAQLIDNRLK